MANVRDDVKGQEHIEREDEEGMKGYRMGGLKDMRTLEGQSPRERTGLKRW